MLKLGFGFEFPDLAARPGLERLDVAFRAWLAQGDAALAAQLEAARARPEALGRLRESELLLALAPLLEDWLAALFAIEPEVAELQGAQRELAPLHACKRQVVQRKAMNKYKADEAAGFDAEAMRARLEALLGQPLTTLAGELAFANRVGEWTHEEPAHEAEIDLALRYAAWAAQTPQGRALHRKGVLFKAPHKLDFMRLIPVEAERRGGIEVLRLPQDHLRRRDGFALTDPGTDLAGGMDQANYCIWCHEQQKDSCSSGLREKKAADAKGAPPFRKSPFGIPLAGCPLEEKISEFNKLRAEGWALGALAMICVDNPLVAATGHRICNDCMKSCIYQKQDPVDIPQSETRVLKDVLALPWGFEIYSLLTRWNPLNLRRPLPRAATGRRVLVVGMGPAGFTLAHHLLNDGHTVVGIDGLKIEPLAAEQSGVTAAGMRAAYAPIRDVAALREALDERVMAGFGGVAEYGITVRWDKNFLKLIRILLERRERFALHGGVRFGGTLDATGAFALGFDHIALCAGAGKPTVLELPNGLANGVRTASDFLMALQLTGAARRDSVANMQLLLPVVVVGGGLTAIDTATESLAYYPLQVEKLLARYEGLATHERDELEAEWSGGERAIAEELLGHARAIRAERAAAAAEGRPAKVLELLQGWGGVTIAYRKRLVDSPSYTLNHEEVAKALEEGIGFAEGLTPLAVEVDADGRARALTVSVQRYDEQGQATGAGSAELPARTILIAAGTQPNTIAAREDPTHFHLDGRYFQALDEQGRAAKPEKGQAKPDTAEVLTSIEPDERAISFFGDLHPSFSGNVVKAMASATRGYPILTRLLERGQAASKATDEQFLALLNGELRATVERVVRLTPTIVEVVVRAPAAVRRFQPGQFYRLQNFETLAPSVNGTRLAMEGIALTGAWVDRERGLISTIVLEMGGSSDLCALLKPGEPVVLMGPTGTPTEIAGGETVVLAGGGLGNAVLFSIGQAFRKAGSRVLYFAGYRRMVDRYKVEEIEAAADIVVWASDEAPGFAPGRPQDKTFVGNIVEAMAAYASGALGAQPIAFADADRVIAIGSDRMMAAVALARSTVLKPWLKPSHRGFASINSPMQCMMKEICAQCLQPHRDPASGKLSYVFSCFNQDQPLDAVDFDALGARLAQNAVQEKLTARWVERCRAGLRAV
jgi:NADPH-dependent glutamate synthase beta subunit-like oxidoreductase/NAD(P)H-flavin reductase